MVKNYFTVIYFHINSHLLTFNRLTNVAYIFRVDAHPELLEFFIIGQRFQNLNLLTTTRINQDITWLFRRILNQNVSPPVHIWRSSWTNNNFFRGSYSYMSVNTIRNNITPQVLAETLTSNGEPTLLFAGEATDTFYGYSNGALSSGYRAADEIINNRRFSANITNIEETMNYV